MKFLINIFRLVYQFYFEKLFILSRASKFQQFDNPGSFFLTCIDIRSQISPKRPTKFDPPGINISINNFLIVEELGC